MFSLTNYICIIFLCLASVILSQKIECITQTTSFFIKIDDLFYMVTTLRHMASYLAACRASPVIISVFGRLRRKTYSRGREDTRSGAKKRFSHDWFHTIFPCMDIFCTTPSPPRKPEGVANHIVRSDLIISRTIERSHFVSFVTVRI